MKFYCNSWAKLRRTAFMLEHYIHSHVCFKTNTQDNSNSNSGHISFRSFNNSFFENHQENHQVAIKIRSMKRKYQYFFNVTFVYLWAKSLQYSDSWSKENQTKVALWSLKITFLNHTSSNSFVETQFKRIWLMLVPEIDGESFLYDPR